MRVLRYTSKTYVRSLKSLDRRAEPADDVRDTVSAILGDVRENGDKAVISLAKKFDKASLTPKTLAVTQVEFAAAEAGASPETKRHVKASHKNVLTFAKKSLRNDWSMKNAQGAEVGEIFLPFERVGCYVPGGSAPLVSTAIMTVTLAAAAGVPEIVACTPCGPDGKVNPSLLYALHVAGATEVYKIGGAQAIAALAYGTKTIRPVAKIFGPGNRFVVEAKRQAIGSVAIDLLPGPSEILILADSSGNASFIASDLLAQAEHGGDSQVCFITDSEKLLDDVQVEVKSQAKTLSRQDPIKNVLKNGTTLVLAESLEQGAEIANGYAPEHITLITRREKKIMPLIRTAGAIFLGNHSAVAAGDFLAGPSHTLPTGGAGKSFPGLTVDMFQKRTSIVRLNPEAAAKSAPIVSALATLEGLDAHAHSATIRAGKRKA
ncbi:histidinol dehydrogenase [Verrucomicrobiales bacterium]|nr:histidinol dehydrogenase [Verrucomicrobiales bacterium]